MTQPAVTPVADSLALRCEVIAACFFLRDRLGYFVGTWGNISVRLTDGLLVTPSRVAYEEVEPDDLVVVGWDRRRRTRPARANFGDRTASPADAGAAGPGRDRAQPLAMGLRVCVHHRTIPVLSDDMAEVIGGEVHCAPTCRPAGTANWRKPCARRLGPTPAPCCWATMAWRPAVAI